jgi:hypothetical protein
LEQTRVPRQSGHFEDPRIKIQDGVDALRLVEEGDQKGQHDGHAQAHCERLFRMILLA